MGGTALCTSNAGPKRWSMSAIGASWPGGFYCPCHGSKFDFAGRVFKNVPAPTNLTVPPYQMVSASKLLTGGDPKT